MALTDEIDDKYEALFENEDQVKVSIVDLFYSENDGVVFDYPGGMLGVHPDGNAVAFTIFNLVDGLVEVEESLTIPMTPDIANDLKGVVERSRPDPVERIAKRLVPKETDDDDDPGGDVEDDRSVELKYIG